MLYRLYLCDSLGVRYSFFFFSGWSCLLFGFRLYYLPFFSMFENINQINQSACCRDMENGQTLDDLKISKYWKVSTKYWNVPVNKEYKIVCCNIIGSISDISNIVMNWLTNQLTTTCRWSPGPSVILSCNNIDIYCQISPSWLWQADSVRNVKWLGDSLVQ